MQKDRFEMWSNENPTAYLPGKIPENSSLKIIWHKKTENFITFNPLFKIELDNGRTKYKKGTHTWNWQHFIG